MEIPWQIMLDSHNFCHPYLEFLCCLQLWPKEWPPKDSWPRPSQDLSWNWLPICCIRNSPLSAQHPPSPPPPLSKNPTSSHPEEKRGNFYVVVKILERNQPRSCRTSATVSWFAFSFGMWVISPLSRSQLKCVPNFVNTWNKNVFLNQYCVVSVLHPLTLSPKNSTTRARLWFITLDIWEWGEQST